MYIISMTDRNIIKAIADFKKTIDDAMSELTWKELIAFSQKNSIFLKNTLYRITHKSWQQKQKSFSSLSLTQYLARGRELSLTTLPP